MKKGGAAQKIVFAGPTGAGKTTAVAALSDIALAHVDDLGDEPGSMGLERHPRGTAEMEYGAVNLADGATIRLYATHGRVRGDALGDIAAEGVIGLVLLIDNARPDPLGDMRSFLAGFREFISRTGVAIGITRSDVRPYPTMDDYYRELEALGMSSAPIFEVDARARKDVSLLVEALLCWVAPPAGH